MRWFASSRTSSRTAAFNSITIAGHFEALPISASTAESHDRFHGSTANDCAFVREEWPQQFDIVRIASHAERIDRDDVLIGGCFAIASGEIDLRTAQVKAREIANAWI